MPTASKEDSTGDPLTQGRIVKIHTSGVHFASDTGKASTDRGPPSNSSKATARPMGVDYDPNSRELHLRSKVELHWMGKGPELQTHADRSRRSLLPRGRIQSFPAALVETDARNSAYGGRRGH